MPTTKELIDSMVHAMAVQEGYFDKPGRLGPTIPQRLHNPVDLRTWLDPGSKDANGALLPGKPYPQVNGFAEFPACTAPNCPNPDHPSEIGWHAGRVQCWNNIVKRGLTFFEFFAGKRGVYAGFAPEIDKNDPLQYATAVLTRMRVELGLDPQVTVHTKILSLASDGNKPAILLRPAL